MPDAAQECEIADCDRLAHSRGRYCSAHAKQAQRGGITRAPIRERLPLWDRVGHLIAAYTDADSDDDGAFDRARDALRKALEEFGATRWQHRAGKARMEGMSPEERSLLGRRAVKARSRKLARNRRIAIARNAGHARAESMSASQRAEIARKAASARWDACSPAGTQASTPPTGEPEIKTEGKRRAAEGD